MAWTRWLIFLLLSPVCCQGEESEFTKNQFFSVFGYNPLMSAEEKELRGLHTQAEVHLRKKEHLLAQKAYEEILDKTDPPFFSTTKYKIDWPTYVDLILRLADTQLSLKEYETGERLLGNLLKTSLAPDYRPAVHFLLARFYAAQNKPGAGYVVMKEALKILPLERWRGEDRSFFHGIEFLLNDHFDKLLKRAKRFSFAHNTTDAIRMYEEVQEAISNGHYPHAAVADSLIQKKVRMRLAELYYKEAAFERTLALVEMVGKPHDKIDCEMLYLAANAYKEKREYEKAVHCFQEILDCKHPAAEQEHVDHALLEIALSHYNASRLLESAACLHKISAAGGKVSLLAQIYLAKIALKQGDPTHALTFLAPLAPLLAKEDPLKFELSYLKADAYYQMGEISHAIELFEHLHTLPTGHKEWSDHAHYKLGLCYLQLAEREPRFQKKAEEILDRLLKKSRDETLLLALAKVYLLQHQEQKVETLLTENRTFFSLEGQARSLLLLAEGKKEYPERKRLLDEATEEKFAACSLYPECWYSRGVNDFKERHYEEAVVAFERAFSFYEKTDQNIASHLLHCETAAHFYGHLPLEALQQLEQVLSTFEGGDEILYLRGQVASHLASEDAPLSSTEKEAYRAVSVSSLEKCAAASGKWSSHALFALGSFYYRQKDYALAKDFFFKLYEKTASSPLAGHALFWLAETLEKMGEEREEVLSLRKRCYEQFPFLSLSPYAHLKCYPLENYLEGEKSALAHLTAFPSLFPLSPLQTLAWYFLALHEPTPGLSFKLFEKAIVLPEPLPKENQRLLLYFRTQSVLELARRALVEERGDLLNLCIDALTTEETLDPSVHEESQLLLAKCYLKSKQEKKAEELLQKILSYYHERGEREGYYVAAVLMEQGRLALQQGDLKAAHVCLETAQTCGEGHLPLLEKHALWLDLSECYKRENQLDAAMKMLSKVINEDATSPMREKAMFLRSEIYELEGRKELAIRQLEATLKRGGVWGEKAKVRLKKTYGME